VLPFPRIERQLKTKVVPGYPAVARSLQGKVKIDCRFLVGRAQLIAVHHVS
jgi:hypothetical protein